MLFWYINSFFRATQFLCKLCYQIFKSLPVKAFIPNADRESLLYEYDINVDICRRIPYIVASKRKHRACAALLNPSSAEPLVWPSPLKFMSELGPDAKALLEAALMDANKGRDKNKLKGTTYPLPYPVHSEGEIDKDNGSEVVHSSCFKCCF